MTISNEAVIIIPGLISQEKGDYLNLLSTCLTEQLEGSITVKEIGELKIEGNTGRRLNVYVDSNHLKNVDIYEVDWRDLFNNKLSERNLKDRLIEGTYLLFYWILSKTWLIFKEVPSLVINLGFCLVLLVTWYYGTITMAMTAIGEDPSFLEGKLLPGWAENIGNLGKAMGGWSVWLIVSALLSFIPIGKVIDQADFVKRYLSENFEGRNLRAKTRSRAIAVVNDVLANGKYQKVTVLAHSFGVAIGTDMLSNYSHQQTVHYITLGSVLKFFSIKSKWVEKEIYECLNNPTLASWIDYYSEQDWFGTKTPLPKGVTSSKIQYKEVSINSSLIERIAGKTHDCLLYFTEPKVLQAIINVNDQNSLNL